MRSFPKRLSHETPAWVAAGSVFHIGIRVAAGWSGSLIDKQRAPRLLEAARFYHERGYWHCRLILLMPDHLHALLAFPPDRSMSQTIGRWKSYCARALSLQWQENFFDHRIRGSDERALKRAYILRNPVAKGLCSRAEEWEWKWEA